MIDIFRNFFCYEFLCFFFQYDYYKKYQNRATRTMYLPAASQDVPVRYISSAEDFSPATLKNCVAAREG